MEISYAEIRAGCKIVIDPEFKMLAQNRVGFVLQTINRFKFWLLETFNGQKFDSQIKKQLLPVLMR